MTPDQKRLVQESWARIAPDPAGAAALLYDRLFTIDPTLRVMFAATDIRSRGARLTELFSVAVHSLDRLDRVLPALIILGRYHAAHGVRDSDRDAVAAALLWTLECGLGPDFTDEVRSAWAAAYTALARTMRPAGTVRAGGVDASGRSSRRPRPGLATPRTVS